VFLKSVSLQSFRSFEKKNLIFSPRINLIIGPNRIGKTNALEAICLLATGKSFRAGREEEMVKKQKETARVIGEIGQNPQQTPQGEVLSILLTAGQGEIKKIYKLNGVDKKWRDFAGTLLVVLFRPEDINLVLGPPAVRRDYLDSVLSQIDWRYRTASLTYKKGLARRNKVLQALRRSQAQKSQLSFWSKLITKNGEVITQGRTRLIDFFNQFLLAQKDNHFSEKKGKAGRLRLVYKKNNLSLGRLENNLTKEINLGMTLIGPHRDDLEFQIRRKQLSAKAQEFKNGRDLARYGSRGEQRMAVLQLKLAELEFISQERDERPVLLLDDIFSELDEKNRSLVLQAINVCQVITTTSQPDLTLDLERNLPMKKIRLA